jgi:hypothetical protein
VPYIAAVWRYVAANTAQAADELIAKTQQLVALEAGAAPATLL